MPTLFQKLQLRSPEPIVVVGAPDEVKGALAEIAETHAVETSLKGAKRDFVLVFVRSSAELEKAAKPAAARVADDGLLWFAYPKKSSKRYQSDLGRDDSWGSLGALGYEPVRMIAVDEDWSALRLRKAEHIKTLTRAAHHALSAAGKARAGAAKPAEKATAKKATAKKKATAEKKATTKKNTPAKSAAPKATKATAKKPVAKR